MNHGARQSFGLIETKGHSGGSVGDAHVVEVATLDIGRKAVFAVVSSPLRMRIFEIIRRAHECSVRELSTHSGLSTTGLYYHLQALEHLELIRQVGVRKGDARRAPAVYATTCERIRVLFNPEDGTHLSRMTTIRRRWNDESMRSLDDTIGLYQTGKIPHVQQRYEWELLTPDEIDEISELFAQVEAVCHRARSRRNLVPDDARPVHLGLNLCELDSAVMPSPAIQAEASICGAALAHLTRQIDHARDRERLPSS
jgi:DNA-binding transcriptional ArsR family regulator